MENEQGEPGSIAELREIAKLIMAAQPMAPEKAMGIAVQVRANDLQQQQVESIEGIADAFYQMCAQIVSFVMSMQAKEKEKQGSSTWEQRLAQQKRR